MALVAVEPDYWAVTVAFDVKGAVDSGSLAAGHGDNRGALTVPLPRVHLPPPGDGVQ